MKRKTILLLTTLTILLSACSNSQSQQPKTSLNATEFAEKLKANTTAPLIDVRSAGEFAGGHLVHAQNIDWNGNSFDEQIKNFDKSKPIFVYCLSGGRSAAAASHMRKSGFKEVYEMSGGMMTWRAANLPEESGDAAAKKEMSLEEFHNIFKSHNLVLVDFYADWCMPCKKMKPYIDELGNEMTGKLSIVRINADENPGLCKELKIDALPTLQVYKNGSLSWNNVGLVSKVEISAHLQ